MSHGEQPYQQLSTHQEDAKGTCLCWPARHLLIFTVSTLLLGGAATLILGGSSHQQGVHAFEKCGPQPGATDLGWRDVKATHQLLSVEAGALPTWINGRFYRQAGGAYIPRHEDIFDGLAHVVFWDLQDGQATFSNNFVDSWLWRMWNATGERLWAMDDFGPENCFDQDKCQSAPIKNANLNVNFWRYGSDIAAASEYPQGLTAVLDDHLSTKRVALPMGGDDPNSVDGFVFTTPAHYLEQSPYSNLHAALYFKIRSTVILGIIPGPPNFEFGYRIYQSRPENLTHFESLLDIPIATFPYGQETKQTSDKRLSYMHTVADTENFFVIIESSWKLDYSRLLAKKGNFFSWFIHENIPIKFRVFKKESDITKLSLRAVADVMGRSPMHVWHLSNSYEKDGKLIVDLTAVNGSSMESSNIGIIRYTLDLDNNTTDEKLLIAGNVEFPAINPWYYRKPYRYFYCVQFLDLEVDVLGLSVIKKVDVQTGEVVTWQPNGKTSLAGSEPQFIPNPAGRGEDHGVLLVPVIDSQVEKSFLLVLDALDMTEVTRVAAPIVVNNGLHNLFINRAISDQSKE
eukprot:gnl/MRDRNA2_/MRDRNA2_29523_c0_seq1.p1 gnl/MRDRNA2_/MRDRNA2_29523_c0~~gnl/MRDRNA2_/MRDRNA2_29523_c0_seq1.p1  ORF type:complete len:571 (+),score=73.55 gnl/MRDRNA2_/MRDRNA2_29523_c0_seq1:81-1793(+)